MRAPRFNFRLSTFNLERLIAVRYLFSRKQRSVVNVISWISLVGLLVSTMALIVVLSVYNGIGDVTKGLFNTFDPELVIEPAEGRTFHTGDIDMGALLKTEGVERVSRIVTETAWMTYGQNQAIVKLRGVDTNYAALTGIDTLPLEDIIHIGAVAVQFLCEPRCPPFLAMQFCFYFSSNMYFHCFVSAPDGASSNH